MLTARTGDQLLIREINLSIILNALRSAGPLSRASLAAKTGLNKTTVSSLVSELVGARFVRERGFRSSSTGRPGILLELNPDAGCIVAAEIGVDFISVILANFSAEIIWRHQEDTILHSGQKEILRRTTLRIQRAFEEAERRSRHILGVAVGAPGLVDVQSGTLIFAPNLQWRDVALKAILQSKFDCPVYVDNEANMAALGESYFGVARGHHNVLYISAGVGLGGGVVLDGQILLGAAGFAGEFGHMTMELDGLPCNCGNHGCWETLVSQWAVFRRVRNAMAAGKTSQLTNLTNGDLEKLTVPLIVEAARDGDGVACEALEETGRYLGIGAANLINAFNPEMVVFGGILSLGSDFVLPTMKRVIEERALLWPRRTSNLVVAAHGSDACVLGGIARVYSHILSQPTGLRTSLKSVVIKKGAIA
jgi:glucokinase-like ROK family protein